MDAGRRSRSRSDKTSRAETPANPIAGAAPNIPGEERPFPASRASVCGNGRSTIRDKAAIAKTLNIGQSRSEMSSTPDLSLPIQEAIFWRGVFIHRYSGVEHTITELLLRSAGRDEYREFGTLPYPWAKKLTRLGVILDAPGPLQPYATDIRNLLTPLTGVERHRHLLVHGMMSCPFEDSPRMLHLKTHDRIGADLGEITLILTIEELIHMTQSMAPFVQKLTRMIARIFNEIDLQPISVADRIELQSPVRVI